MKVCTDACLFAAWVAAYLQKNKINPGNILDIGTGTGLISLMLAQKTLALIDAVEINTDAALQAKENFNASPWKQRLNVFETGILQYNTQMKYDLIISNPPFFNNDLRSPDKNKNTAKHDDHLGLPELIKAVNENLSDTGRAAVLLPYSRTNFFETHAAKKGLFIIEKISVKQTPAHPAFRSIMLCAKKEKVLQQAEIIIHNDERKYTNEFIELLKDYYLKL